MDTRITLPDNKELTLQQQKKVVRSIINTDKPVLQRISAKKVTDDRLLYEIVISPKTSQNVAIDIIARIEDQRYLGVIVINKETCPMDLRKDIALHRITDQQILKALYKKVSDKTYKSIIIEKITDLDFLFYLVKRSMDRQIKGSIIERMFKLDKRKSYEKLSSLRDSWIDFQLMFV